VHSGNLTALGGPVARNELKVSDSVMIQVKPVNLLVRAIDHDMRLRVNNLRLGWLCQRQHSHSGGGGSQSVRIKPTVQ
jgi:hypothetical protein